jgi:protein-tyrosine-phosphatase
MSSLAKSSVVWLRDLRHVPESLAHSRRRNAARAQLASLQARRILFVCHGNICRSPFAAALFDQSLPIELFGTIKVSSAGFIGADRGAPEAAIAAALRYGVDISQHRSRVITSELLRDVDLILVMSSAQAQGISARLRFDSIPVVVLGDLDPLPVDRRTILDPWNGSDEVFAESYSRLHRCVAQLAQLISTAFGVATLGSIVTAPWDSQFSCGLADEEP